MLVIGICGASGSGKSTLAQELSSAIGPCATVINHDCYYRDHPSLTLEERQQLNYDEPEIFDHDLFLEDMKTLMAGKPITRKRYDYANHRRDDTDELIYPTEVLIIEGIHVFYDERLCELMFLKLYMSVEPDICLLRRITRDINERGTHHREHLRAVPDHGETHVRQAHPQLHRPGGCDRGPRRQKRPDRQHSGGICARRAFRREAPLRRSGN